MNTLSKIAVIWIAANLTATAVLAAGAMIAARRRRRQYWHISHRELGRIRRRFEALDAQRDRDADI